VCTEKHHCEAVFFEFGDTGLKEKVPGDGPLKVRAFIFRGFELKGRPPSLEEVGVLSGHYRRQAS